MAESPLTLRLDKETRQRVARVARQKGVSASEVIREAIESWLKVHDTASAPYDTVADLIGEVHGNRPKRSTQTGKQFKELLKRNKRS